MKSLTLLGLLLLCVQVARATHLLGGYIQVRPVSGSTYQLTVILYLDEVKGKSAADQMSTLPLCFGDGTTGTLVRATRVLSENKTISINTFYTAHTYAGPGTYTLTTNLPNRTQAQNIGNQVMQEQGLLTLATTFTTNTTTPNRTPTLSLPSTGFNIPANQRVVASLRATDDDSDSLSYSLTRPLTNPTTNDCGKQPVTLYQYPNDLTRRGTFKLNAHTGDLTWDAPVQQGYYSVAYTVNEYRNGVLISQTNGEFPFIVEDRPGTPGVLPPYEPAIENNVGIVTALSHDADADVLLSVFPNPTDDRLQVVIQSSSPAPATLRLSDATGRQLHELTFRQAARQHEQLISLSSLPPGVYVLRADVSGRSLVRKIVKK